MASPKPAVTNIHFVRNERVVYTLAANHAGYDKEPFNISPRYFKDEHTDGYSYSLAPSDCKAPDWTARMADLYLKIRRQQMIGHVPFDRVTIFQRNRRITLPMAKVSALFTPHNWYVWVWSDEIIARGFNMQEMTWYRANCPPPHYYV